MPLENRTINQNLKYDYIVIGSGFGGSISAMRLAQKGYAVLVLEKGKRWNNSDFPKTNWNIRKFIWAPIIKCFGIQQISFLKGIMVLHGAGVGGGSLVYANTLLIPEKHVFEDSQLPKNINWFEELSSHYQTAKRILGVQKNIFRSEADLIIQKLARKFNCEDTFQLTDVGIYFSDTTENNTSETDPYFNGHGPIRTPCNGCGACMIGCPRGSKNTLDKNYLYFAEKYGAKIRPETLVEKIIPQLQSEYRYGVQISSSTKYFSKSEIILSKNVIISAGVLGTLKLLFKNKYISKTLPRISDQLGAHVLSNGESLCGATRINNDKDFSKGIAIGSSFKPNSYTKIEPVRYPAGSDVMKLLASPLTENGNVLTRPLKMLKNIFLHLSDFYTIALKKHWAERTIILLVMQSIEQKMNLGHSRFWAKLGVTKIGNFSTTTLPSYLPVAQEASNELAKIIQGIPQNAVTEVLFKTPATAHILGGCQISETPDTGVINSNHEIHHYPGLFICDGSVVTMNLGVNPSLTISAFAERFAQRIPMSNHITIDEYKKRTQII